MPDDFKSMVDLNRVIHEPARLIIVAILYAVASTDFLYLLRETGLTKGNLGSHLARLEEAGYVKIEKSFRGKIPLTTASLTEEGRSAFREYRERVQLAVASLPK